MPSYRVEPIAAEYGPLCQKCLGSWGIGDNHLNAASESKHHILIEGLETTFTANRSLKSVSEPLLQLNSRGAAWIEVVNF